MVILVKWIEIEKRALFVHFYMCILIYTFNKYAKSTYSVTGVVIGPGLQYRAKQAEFLLR